MDKLERFIRDNREAFDSHEPPADLWAKLETNLPAQPERLNGLVKPLHGSETGPFRNQITSMWGGMRWQIAATITLLLLAGGYWWTNDHYGVSEQPEVVVFSPAYAKEFTQYARLIDDKRSELRDMTEQNPALYQQFATDLDRLEKNYQGLKADLPKNPNQEVLIQAMIQNLQLQIDLLNQQLDVIQRIKQQNNNQTNEKLM